jgi:hypothetical protein
MTNTTVAADVAIVEWDDLMLLKHEGNKGIDIGRDGGPEGDANATQDYRVKLIQQTKKRIQDAIEKSYGINGIGIMAIRGVPNFVSYKDRFLPQAYILATQLSESYRETYLSDPVSFYNSGWSFGKERLGNNKPPDISKGSYYYNPITDTPGTEQERSLYPSSFPCNKWPIDVQEENELSISLLLSNFQENAKQIGILLKDVTIEVAKHLDVYVKTSILQQQSQPSHTNDDNNDYSIPQLPTTTTASRTTNYISIHDNLKNTEKVKVRLLYYYPIVSGNNNDNNNNNKVTSSCTNNAEDSWVGTSINQL